MATVRHLRSPAVTSRIMKMVRRTDTGPELLFRKALRSRGVRFRKHHKGLAGTPDVVVPFARLALFVDGDFWHGNSWKLRGLASLEEQFPNRTEFWVNKIERNMRRDRKVTRSLRKDGWTVIRFWESDVFADVEKCVDKTMKAIQRYALSSRS